MFRQPGEQAAALLQARVGPTIVLAGHIHVRDAHAEGRILQLVQAALVEPPFEAAVLDVCAGGRGGVLVARRARRTSDRRGEYEPALVEAVGSWRFENGCWTNASADTSALRPQRSVGGAIGSMS